MSRPSEVYSTPSALSTRSLPRRLTIAITAAPRARSRSTVRLVSVVVPLWLTAIASVSRMSRRSWNPDSSVASSASMSSSPSLSSSSRAAVLWPAIAAVPWPITRMRRIVPAARRAAMSGVSARSPTAARSNPSRSMILPRSVLRIELRRLGDLLQQEVRRVAAIDIARRDRRGGEFGGHDGQPPYRRNACAGYRPVRRRGRRRGRRSRRRPRHRGEGTAASPRPRRRARWRR